jgi:methylenetetrahydrofolate reductase (NADPH)
MVGAPPHVYSSPGRLERVLRSGEFAVTAELTPPDSADPQDVYACASAFDDIVDALNATDGSGASCHMSSLGVCGLLVRKGYSMVMQVSCRDRNRIAVQGDVLGASALGICNVMCLTADGVQTGDQPGAKPIFDLDCMSALSAVRTMRDEGRFLSGRTLKSAPNVFLGAAANPFAPPLDFRPERLAKKVASGAQFVQMQHCFDIARLRNYMDRVRDLGLDEQVFILVGVGPLASARAAEWMRTNVPGVHIPYSIIERLKGASDQRAEGRSLCVELIQQIRDIKGVAGVHVMAFKQERAVAEIIRNSRVLGERKPWHPDADASSSELGSRILQ